MKTNVITMFVLIILLCNCSDSKKTKKNDLEEMNLHGNVKSVREKKYRTADQFGKLDSEYISCWYDTKTYFDKSGFEIDTNAYNTNNLDSTITKIIDEKGILFITIDSIYNRPSIKKDVKYLQYIRKYIGSGHLTEEYEYDQNGNIKVSNIYVYDIEGHMIKKDEVKGSVKRFYTYDQFGNTIEKLYCNSKGEILSKYVYTYDKNGNLTEELCLDLGNTFEHRISSKYDDKDNMVWRNWDNHNDYYDYTESFSYDKEGNIVEYSEYFSRDSSLVKRFYKYEFDNHHNWVLMQELDNAEQEFVTERKIEYY